jgi:hypothetical protein
MRQTRTLGSRIRMHRTEELEQVRADPEIAERVGRDFGERERTTVGPAAHSGDRQCGQTCAVDPLQARAVDAHVGTPR